MKRTWITYVLLLTAALVTCIAGVALAVDVQYFTWNTEYTSGDWDDPSRWESTDPGYPNGTAHNVTIEGAPGDGRMISLIDANVGSLTLEKRKITFDSKGETGKTISIHGTVVIQAGGSNPVEVTVTDDAELDSGG